MRPVARILLLGSGELGREFTIAAKRLGAYVIACDSYEKAPAMQVADDYEVLSMLDGEALAAVIEKHRPDHIVPEVEAIRTEVLLDFEDKGYSVVPSARATMLTMNRDRIRDVAANELGLVTSRFLYAETLEEMRAAVKAVGIPCVV
jgi:phosphoribosylglycinamide formyltransferase 2